MEEELEVLEAILGQALKVEKDILRLTILLEARLGQLTKLVWHQANSEEASNESMEQRCFWMVVLIRSLRSGCKPRKSGDVTFTSQ